MCRKLSLIFFVLLIGLAASNQTAAEIIYYDNFDGPSGIDLNGRQPDISPGGEVWVAGSWIDADGSYGGGSSGQMFTAGLPFTPSIGTIYELSATVDNYGDWVAIGFVSEGFAPGDRFIGSAVNSGILWALARQDEGGAKDQAFIGPATAGGLGDATTHSATELMVRIETNSETSWVVTWYFDGSKEFERVINPTALGIIDDIDYAAFGSNGMFSACTGTISSFTLEEITTPLEAWYPSPEDEATGLPRNTVLSWRPGIFADKHDVYLGTDFNAVNDATRTSDPCGVLVSQDQDPNSYSATGLVPGATYYWRIDEVNDLHPTQIWPGNVWSFTVIPPTAANPVPSDGDIYVNPSVQLSWTPGPCADKHDVYFGTSFNDVNDANRDDQTGLLYYSENQDANHYPAAGTLNLGFGRTYYWRVDEVNEANNWKGDIWRFTTELLGGGAVLGNWEQSMDEWFLWGGTSSYSNTTGVTLDSYSLRQEITPADGYMIVLSLADIPGGVDAFFGNNIFSIDVTRLASEWTGDGSSSITLYIQADGAGWVNLGAPANSVWTPGDGDRTVKLNWDYSDLLSQVDPNASRIDFMLWQNSADFTIGGVYYLDNARLGMLVFASNPNPADSATDVQRNPSLIWTPGMYADKHDVYFGTNFNDVSDANRTSDPCGVLVSQDQEPNYYKPGVLEPDTTYYWRIDEVNDACAPYLWQGSVWSFTTGNYIVVDNMDEYGDNIGVPWEPGDAIFYIWRDGWLTEVEPHGNDTGSQVYHWDGSGTGLMESTIVNSSPSSMPFYYENDGDTDSKPTGGPNPDNPLQYYSEATASISDLPLPVGPDWTTGGIRALSLWFYGDPNNDANATEQMYVKLNGVKVLYDGDMDDIREPFWHEWNVDLADFGINLSNVTSISIGFGDEDNTTTPGGAGIVYFDDIQLHPPRCILSRRLADFAMVDYAPAGDPAGDCVIDYQEIGIMGSDWLADDGFIATTNPGTTGLFAHYPLNEGAGTTVSDLSVNGGEGTINNPNGGLGTAGSVWDTDPERGTVLSFDGDDSTGAYVSVDTNIPALGLGDNFTWAFWAKQDVDQPLEVGPGGGYADVIIGNRDGGTQSPLQFAKFTPTFFDYYNNDNSMSIDYENIPGGVWIHHAVVKNGTTLTYYRNGTESGTSTVTATMDENPFFIGGEVTRERWRGWVSELRLYSRPLSGAEIAYLADTTPGDGQLYVPVLSDAELYKAEEEGSRSVNLRDFGVLAEMWLEEHLWPQP